MSNSFDYQRRKANPNTIEFPFDFERTPRDQIEAALTSVKPQKCERHSHELLRVDNVATVDKALRHDYPHQREPICAKFVSIHLRCSSCPHNNIDGEIFVDGCPVHFTRFGKRIGALDQAGKPLPEFCDAIALQPDLTVRQQFDEWLADSEKFRCEKDEGRLTRHNACMTAPFKSWIIEPEFANCPQCGLEHLGISPDEAYASFESFTLEPPEVYKHWETCRTFAANPEGVLLLMGNCGTGKTHLSIACLRERLKTGDADLKFIKHRHFIRQYRLSLRAVPFGQEAAESPLPSCRKAGFLVYDEIAPSNEGNGYEDVLLDLFEKRIGHFKPTIITTNLSRNEMEPALGTRLFDRLRGAAFAVLEFGFESRRVLHNEQYLNRVRSRLRPTSG
jgi:DNA replication protein DnaC